MNLIILFAILVFLVLLLVMGFTVFVLFIVLGGFSKQEKGMESEFQDLASAGEEVRKHFKMNPDLAEEKSFPFSRPQEVEPEEEGDFPSTDPSEIAVM
jgi:hypothetical protein